MEGENSTPPKNKQPQNQIKMKKTIQNVFRVVR